VSTLERTPLELRMLAAWLNVPADKIPPENTTHLENARDQG